MKHVTFFSLGIDMMDLPPNFCKKCTARHAYHGEFVLFGHKRKYHLYIHNQFCTDRIRHIWCVYKLYIDDSLEPCETTANMDFHLNNVVSILILISLWARQTHFYQVS